jgi:hypothetical protein
MLMQFKKYFLSFFVILPVLVVSTPAKADFWGGDLIYLAQILEQAIVQVQQLKGLLGTSKESYQFLQEINEGQRTALRIINTMNRVLKPGNLSNLSDVNAVIREIQDIYGKIPITAEAKLQSTNDTTVAESIQLHNDVFRYADEVDPEAERIKNYAQVASPQGAAKASLEAQGAIIHVLNQVLRTNAAILKIQSENLAMQNRKSKMQSEAFRSQYGEISTSLRDFKPGFDLPSISRTN